ncbi:hypothetical protein [Devosia sp. 1635]|uniref:hypothetical protein n=1 Tax=Devosia sp. 1635 TaxID=2726066 RepID=UPI001564C2EC|nr:hypothetical protein [Devosia sp. 1635]
MDHCNVLRSESGALEPLIISALASDRVGKIVDDGDLTHPLPVVSRSWSAVVAAFSDVLLALHGPDPHAKAIENHDAILRAHQDLLYRIAEFVEAVEKQTRVVVGKYVAPRNLDRALSEQCNAIKHEGARVGWVSARDAIMRVPGYQLRHLHGRSEIPMERFHKKRPSFSFNMELRRLVVNLYLLGDHAGRAVIDAAGPGASRKSDDTIAMLEHVIVLPPVIFPGERQLPAPHLALTGLALEVASRGGAFVALDGEIQIRHLHAGDGITSNFGLADV